MSGMLRAVVFVITVVVPGSVIAAEVTLERLSTGQLRVGQLVEFRVEGLPQYCNPFDPAEVTVDAEFTTPSFDTLRVPVFHMIPHCSDDAYSPWRRAKALDLFINTSGGNETWHLEQRLDVLIDDLELVDEDAEEGVERVVSVDDFEADQPKWKPKSPGPAVYIVRQAHRGNGALLASWVVQKPRGLSGAYLSLNDDPVDLSRFEKLRMWVCRSAGTAEEVPWIAFYLDDKNGGARRIGVLDGAPLGEWRQFEWELPPAQAMLCWSPDGPPQWRLRFRPQHAGEYECKVRVRDNRGDRWSCLQTLAVADAHSDGYIGVSKQDRRYLAFDSGKPFFPVGINIRGRDLRPFHHYVGRLANHGGNFIRTFLTQEFLGLEETKQKESIRYDQTRAARLDELLRFCDDKGVYVMFCLADAVDAKMWGDACSFFTDPAAKDAHKAKLRYLVVRYGHSPHLLSWELFNEVNGADKYWQELPDYVRSWHNEMAKFLNSVDPQKHPITSSFNFAHVDDSLWEQPLIEITQQHPYLTGPVSFVPFSVAAHDRLAGHGKPILCGEFGRHFLRYEDWDSDGVSLHNGLWASVLSGGCGTAMSWWWEWIDRHSLWQQYDSISTFLAEINWPAEQFHPSQRAAVCARPDPEHAFGPLRFVPRDCSLFPVPCGSCDTPVTLQINADGTLDAPEDLPYELPADSSVEFKFGIPTPRTLRLYIERHSHSSGAKLPILANTTSMDRDRDGFYSADISECRDTVKIENTGSDSVNVALYEFSARRQTPPVSVLSLRGNRTNLVWIWNESHAWYRPIYEMPLLDLRQVSVTLDDFEPGGYRVRRFDPWAGKWEHPESEIAVGTDGRLELETIDNLRADVAFRLECVEP